jgi:Zn-dependent hydrolases, including glyoxylases
MVPRFEMLDGFPLLPVRSVTLPPARRTLLIFLGDEDADKLLIDPSPISEEESRRLLTTIKDFVPDSIFLTHHHPDHPPFSNKLARGCQVPIILSKDTLRHLTEKYGQPSFVNIELRTVSANLPVRSWPGFAVRVSEIPGHDSGPLGLAPDSLAWFFVGDLLPGIGAVVIPSPEGDMAAYLNTLKKVISLSPEVIIPSLGIPMSTPHRLEETLNPRLQRDSQILDLHRFGKSKPEHRVNFILIQITACTQLQCRI